MAERQLIVVVEGTAALAPYWSTILCDYLEKIVRCYYGGKLTGQKLNGTNTELAFIVFNAHGPYSAFVVQRSGWTKDLEVFLNWLSAMRFSGGGFSDAAIAEGLSEALMMFPANSNGPDAHQSPEAQKQCILVAASNPHPLPTPVYRPSVSSSEHKENAEVLQTDTLLADAETVAKSFGQCFVSLSVISPKQLPKLRAIYNAGKRNPRSADPPVDNIKNSHFLVLLSENFGEACAALSRPIMTNQGISNQGIVKLDGVSAAPISGLPATVNPGVNGSMMPRQPIAGGSIPTATVKVEPTTVPSMISGSGFPHLPSIASVASQGVSSLQNSSPSQSSQEMSASIDTTQEIKPLVNPISQSLRPTVPAPANVSILNNLSQHRQALPTMGGPPMAVHMSNMISSGMASSALSGISSVPGSGPLMATSQVVQNSTHGSLASASSNLSANSNIGISSTLNNLQGNMTVGPAASNVGQGTLTSGAQIGQGGMTINQNMMNNLVSSGVSSGPGSMMPTPGISQQAGVHSNGMANNTAINMPLTHHPPNIQQSQSKYCKIWEGSLSGQRQGQPVFICKLEGYRNQSASDSLAADWPPTMQIVRLIAQEHMNNKQYVGKADFLVFRTLNQHGFLGQLQEKKLCAVIQLPSQTLLLSVSDKAGRLIGMLFPGDMVVFKPQVPGQQPPQQQSQIQQLQQLQPQSQPHSHLQQQQQQQQQLQQPQLQQVQQHQHLQTQPLQLQQQSQPMQLQQQSQPMQLQQQSQPLQQQQQQMVNAGIGQTFIQGHGRSQMMTQAKLPQAGPTNITGGGFLP